MDIEEEPAKLTETCCTDPTEVCNQAQTELTTDIERQTDATRDKHIAPKVMPKNFEITSEMEQIERPNIGRSIEVQVEPEDFEKWRIALLNRLNDDGLSKSHYVGKFYDLLRDISRDTGLTGWKNCTDLRKYLKQELVKFFPGDKSEFY